VSFVPTDHNLAENAASQTPIQNAIKLLSLRIPQFVGAKSIAPSALLNAAGGAGIPFQGVPGGLEEWLRRLFEARTGDGPDGGHAPQASVIPHITPGNARPGQPPEAPWNPRPPQPIGPISGAPAPRPAPPPLGPPQAGRWRTY
jgi:hypothetical protein